jgi:hypothetical protein
MGITRRGFMLGCAAAAAAVSMPAWLWQRGRLLARRLVEMLPINRQVPAGAELRFSGDNPDDTHSVLWDIPRFLDQHGISDFASATPDERASLVIVGGGMSGLCTAWLLRDRNPVVLERAERMGGNARGESWQGIDYSIGAAYLLEPDPDSELEALYREWGVAELCRVRTEEDPVLIGGRIFRDFWSGESDPEAAESFRSARDYFVSVWNGESDTPYPEMPTEDAGMLAVLDGLDSMSFREHLEGVLGGKLHPHLAAVIDRYCWSSLGGTWDEVSAAAGLNFFAAEFGNVWVAPGGNAGVAEQVTTMLHEALPANHLRTGATVFRVAVREDGVLVGYIREDGSVHTVLAQAVAMCCPKFVVKRVLEGIEPEREEAINSLRYRSYLLANVLLDQPLEEEFYDLFLADVDHSEATDVVCATWARPLPNRTVLTLYRALPYDGARPAILASESHARFRVEFERQVRESILPALGVAEDRLVEIRPTRWGHPLPLAAVGQVRSGIPGRLREPFRERVFFVEQDNWALPAIETSLEEALHFAPRIRAVLSA